MQNDVILHYGDDPEKIVDLEWLEEELHRIRDDADLTWNTSKRCTQFILNDEAEYQLLYRWSEHVGATLEVNFHNAYIYR